MEGYIAEVRMFGGNFAPQGWAFCQGQLLSIAENTALFSLVGTIYGGDGQTTFALPNFSSRAAIGVGQGPGLSPYSEGQTGGIESFTININQMAAHVHPVSGTAEMPVSSQDGHSTDAVNNYPAISGDMMYSSATDNSTMAPASIALTSGQTGGAQPISNIKPYLAINFIICLEGIYPSRN